MPREFSDADVELYRRIDEILHYVWDPIGVRHIPQARDEYDGYVPGLFAMLQGGADSAQVATYLSEVVESRMGLTGDSAHSRKVAELLVDWKEHLDSSDASS
ncbi:MAG: hypothetical protein KC561_05815 [Myxococcales bacterium]|nr:hypothetical protein [Myxococcales bacterium]